MTNIHILKKSDVFKDLDDDRLSSVINCGKEVEFSKGARIFTHGEDATHIWIVTEGDVELRSEPQGIFVPGESSALSFTSAARAFGWTCFVPPYKYRLSGYCASDKCNAIKLKKEDLLGLFEADKGAGFQVMQGLIEVVSRQFEQLQEEIVKRRGRDIMSRW
jgi:CRP-like cAMP-binding protein